MFSYQPSVYYFPFLTNWTFTTICAQVDFLLPYVSLITLPPYSFMTVRQIVFRLFISFFRFMPLVHQGRTNCSQVSQTFNRQFTCTIRASCPIHSVCRTSTPRMAMWSISCNNPYYHMQQPLWDPYCFYWHPIHLPTPERMSSGR